MSYAQLQIPTGWADLPFWSSEWPALAARLDGQNLLPAVDDTFRALWLTPPDATRVVILGQDPYPTPGHAHGLAFSVADGTIPRSLRNIFKELKDDLNVSRDLSNLSDWAAQGVLLLNTALTVPPGQAGAHAGMWDGLVDQIIARVPQDAAFVLWGAKAQARVPQAACRIASPHPSPLSARRGFFGSKPFSQVNAWLESRGQTPIDWRDPTDWRDRE